MNKFLFGIVVLLVIASCSGNGVSEKKNDDFSAKADSIAAATQAAEAEAEARQARIDSIRLDSISRVEKIKEHFGPRLFLDIYEDGSSDSFKENIPRTLKKDGFKFVSKEYVKDLICVGCGDPDGEELIPGYKIKYENKEIGVIVEWTFDLTDKESVINEYNGVTIDFKNPEMEKQFLSKVLAVGFKKHKTEWGTVEYRSDYGGMTIFYEDGKFTIAYIS